MTSISEWKTRASAALRAGRIDEGIEAYRALTEAGQDDSNLWYNFGYLLRCGRHFDEALDAYGKALERGIGRPEEVLLNRAVIMSEFTGRPDAAEAELHQAVSLNPMFVPAWLNLGNLYEDGGNAAGARDAYLRVLAIEPANGRAIARIAAIHVFEGSAAQVLPSLRSALARPGITSTSAAELGFALGAALDAEGRHDEAFAAFSAANRAALAATHPAYRYDRRQQEQVIDALIAAPPAAQPKVLGNRPAPIFICGMFRSGSTLIEQMLSRHSRVSRGGELEIIPALAAEFTRHPDALSRLAPATLAQMRARYWDEVDRIMPHADRMTDKRPDNFLHIGLIKRIFPDARIIHTTRSPLDTALSIYFLYFADAVTYGHDLDDIAHWFGQYRRLMAHWQALYPDDILDISYDALVRGPAAALASASSFCGLAWEDAMLTPEHADGPVRTASVWQVRQRLHQRSSGRWRYYARHLPAALRELDTPSP